MTWSTPLEELAMQIRDWKVFGIDEIVEAHKCMEEGNEARGYDCCFDLNKRLVVDVPNGLMSGSSKFRLGWRRMRLAGEPEGQPKKSNTKTKLHN
jgi:hypothetical protein